MAELEHSWERGLWLSDQHVPAVPRLERWRERGRRRSTTGEGGAAEPCFVGS